MKHGPAPVIQYWHSREAPAEVQCLIDTFSAMNPSLPHLVFDERGAEEFIAERFTAREVAAFRACAVPAMQADYFRYCAVYALGGIYADADFHCILPLRPLIDATAEARLFRNSKGHLINGFFVAREPGHPLLRLAREVATTNIERRATDKVHMATGPWVFSLLRGFHRVGSLEAVRRRPISKQLGALVDSVLDAVGDYANVAEAFDSVDIFPIEAAFEWIAKPTEELPYKLGKGHWVNWNRDGRSIYR